MQATQTKQFVFDKDPFNEDKYVLYNVDAFVPSYREEFDDEYTEKNLYEWADYINTQYKYGKRLPVLIHHASEEKNKPNPIYVGYMCNARVQGIMFPKRDVKTNKYIIQEVPALIIDIYDISKNIKDLIIEGFLPNRSISFKPKRDKKSDPPFDEVSHFALLTSEELPFHKLRDMNKDTIADMTGETADFSENFVIDEKLFQPLNQYRQTLLKNFSDEPSITEIQRIVDELEEKKPEEKEYYHPHTRWYPDVKVDDEFRRLVLKYMRVLDYPRKRAVAAAYNSIGRYGSGYDFNDENIKELAKQTEGFTKDFPAEIEEIRDEKAENKLVGEKTENFRNLVREFLESYKDFGERWITLHGGQSDKEEGGGVHIKIDDNGNILAGPEALKGRNLSKLSKIEKTKEKKVKKVKGKKEKDTSGYQRDIHDIKESYFDKQLEALEKPATKKQLQFLKDLGYKGEVKELTKLGASDLIGELLEKREKERHKKKLENKNHQENETDKIAEKKFRELIRKEFEEKWVTIGKNKGVHVKIDEKGEIKTGPKYLEGKNIKEAGKQIYENKKSLTKGQKEKIEKRVGILLEKEKAREKIEREKPVGQKIKEKLLEKIKEVSNKAETLARPLEKKGYSKKTAKAIAITATVLASTPASITSIASPIVGAWGLTPGLGQVEAGIIYGGAMVSKTVAKKITGRIKNIMSKKKTKKKDSKQFQENSEYKNIIENNLSKIENEIEGMSEEEINLFTFSILTAASLGETNIDDAIEIAKEAIVNIGDKMKEITEKEFRELVRKNFEERWITIGGKGKGGKALHVKIDDNGNITAGPSSLKGTHISKAGENISKHHARQKAEGFKTGESSELAKKLEEMEGVKKVEGKLLIEKGSEAEKYLRSHPEAKPKEKKKEIPPSKKRPPIDLSKPKPGRPPKKYKIKEGGVLQKILEKHPDARKTEKGGWDIAKDSELHDLLRYHPEAGGKGEAGRIEIEKGGELYKIIKELKSPTMKIKAKSKVRERIRELAKKHKKLQEKKSKKTGGKNGL